MVLIEISVPKTNADDVNDVASPDAKKTDKMREWAIVELQGTLEMQAHCKDDPLAGKLIGDLHFTASGEPTLIIGHHILYGKMTKLEKPFAIVKKRGGVGNDSLGVGSDSAATQTRYDVMGLIKHKLLFNQRPKPIIANVPKKV